MSSMEHEREEVSSAASRPGSSLAPGLPLALVALLLTASALLGAALAMDRPAQGQVVLPVSEFVIPWTGYLERDGVPHNGGVRMGLTVRDEGGSGQAPVEFPLEMVNVENGRFSLLARPIGPQRDALAAMRRPVMSLRVGLTAQGVQELFGSRPLRVAQSALQSGGAREPSFEQGVSVAGVSRVSAADVGGLLDLTGGGTLVVGGEAAAESAEVTGGIDVQGTLAALGGLHLVNPANSAVAATGSSLRFTHAGDIPLLHLDADGVSFSSRLILGRSDTTQVSGGNGVLELASNRLRLEGNDLYLSTGRTHVLQGGPSNRGVQMAGGVEFDGRFPNMRRISNAGRFWDFVLTASRGDGNNFRSRDLASASDHLCVLSGMLATHEDKEYSCQVRQSGGQWQLVAHIPSPRTGGASLSCRAMCMFLGGL